MLDSNNMMQMGGTLHACLLTLPILYQTTSFLCICCLCVWRVVEGSEVGSAAWACSACWCHVVGGCILIQLHWKIDCRNLRLLSLHSHSKRLGWSGFGLNTFLQSIRVHVHTFNTREVIHNKLNRLGKRAAHHHANFTDKKVTYSAISVYSMAILYCDEACAACGRWVQWSSYEESEITSLIPQAPSSSPSFHHLQYIVPAMGSWVGAWEHDYSFTDSVLNVNQNPACLWSQLRSDLRAFAFLLQHLPFYLTEGMWTNCWNATCTKFAITTSQKVLESTIEILFA